jgi:hypothetical protein
MSHARLWVGGLPPVLGVERRCTRRTGRKGPTYKMSIGADA